MYPHNDTLMCLDAPVDLVRESEAAVAGLGCVRSSYSYLYPAAVLVNVNCSLSRVTAESTRSACCILSFYILFVILQPSIYSPAQLKRGFTLSVLLDEPWPEVSSLRPMLRYRGVTLFYPLLGTFFFSGVDVARASDPPCSLR